ncbi:MAG TPA: hypothetical protein PKA31_01970 [Candidatus Moranbacteria bacterium]|nr:hypothetical protein [Candidatus Moranbacteria bacterium]
MRIENFEFKAGKISGILAVFFVVGFFAFFISHNSFAAETCAEGRVSKDGKCVCREGLVPRDYVYPDVGPCITSEERSFTGTPNDPNVADNTPSPGIYGDKGMFGELISKLLEQVFTVVG